MLKHSIPGLTLGRDLSLRIGDAAEVRLTPRAGFELAEALLRGATEQTVREAARGSRESRPSRRKVAA